VFTESNFATSLDQLGPAQIDIADKTGVFRELSQSYGESGRHYHDQTHVSECLEHFSTCRELAERPAEVEIALWFHDAIYDTRSGDNEERSADWAAKFLNSIGIEQDVVSRIHQMIVATKTHVAASPDESLLLDIDLGILGASPEAFERYDAAIRSEYSWVPLEQYVAGRLGILKSFLDRPKIYQTDFFGRILEDKARVNLAAKVAELAAK